METPSGPGTMVALTRLAKVVYRHCPESRLGVRLRHLMALSYLRYHGEVPQQELTEALCMDANNLVLLLNELEDAGLAERRRDPSDRRRHLVTLTTAGLSAQERAERAQESVEDEVLSTLDADERATLRNLLVRALAVSDQPVAGREPVVAS